MGGRVGLGLFPQGASCGVVGCVILVEGIMIDIGLDATSLMGAKIPPRTKRVFGMTGLVVGWMVRRYWEKIHHAQNACSG